MKKKISKFYFKNEKELMRSLGLNPTPGSGNRVIKEDGQNEKVIAQLKSTEGDSITIKLSDLNTLIYNSKVSHKLPIFINQFVDGPILISCMLRDFNDVAKYIKTGEYNKKEESLVVTNEELKINKIKSTKRTKVKNAIQKEKEKRINEIKEERKRRR